MNSFILQLSSHHNIILTTAILPGRRARFKSRLSFNCPELRAWKSCWGLKVPLDLHFCVPLLLHTATATHLNPSCQEGWVSDGPQAIQQAFPPVWGFRPESSSSYPDTLTATSWLKINFL